MESTLINEEAKRLYDLSIISSKASFIEGAMSNVTKKYWQQGIKQSAYCEGFDNGFTNGSNSTAERLCKVLYSEEEVINSINEYYNEMVAFVDPDEASIKIPNWFNINKK